MNSNSESSEEGEFEIFNKHALAGKIVHVNCNPFYDYANINVGVIVTLNDITISKKIEQVKSNLIDTVSHEIRSPMASIAMQIDSILDGLVGNITPE